MSSHSDGRGIPGKGAEEYAAPAPRGGSVEEVIAKWSLDERTEAARNLLAVINILREWDDEERLGRARRMLESASPEE